MPAKMIQCLTQYNRADLLRLHLFTSLLKEKLKRELSKIFPPLKVICVRVSSNEGRRKSPKLTHFK